MKINSLVANGDACYIHDSVTQLLFKSGFSSYRYAC